MHQKTTMLQISGSLDINMLHQYPGQPENNTTISTDMSSANFGYEKITV
jgi:hypothetical protein